MRAEAFHWFIRGLGLGLGLVAVVAVASALVVAAKVLVLVFIALLLASGLEPVISWLRARLPLGRGTTILIVYAGFFVLVVALALLVIPGAINQFHDFGARVKPLLANLRESVATLEPPALAQTLATLVETLQGILTPRGGDGPDVGAVIEVGITVADLAISVVSVLALVFFWLTERARLQRFALALVPPERRHAARQTWNEIEVRLGSWVRGQLILMGTLGVMATTAYFLLGLEGALLLGVIAAITEAIPLVGPLIGAVPALLVAAMTGQVEFVLLVAAVYVVIQVVEGNILVPLVMRNTIGTPPFLVLASILAGAAIGGIIGALLAVPLVAALIVILERLQARDRPIPLEPGSAEPDLTPEDGTQPEPAARSRGGTTDPRGVHPR